MSALGKSKKNFDILKIKKKKLLLSLLGKLKARIFQNSPYRLLSRIQQLSLGQVCLMTSKNINCYQPSIKVFDSKFIIE